MDPVAGSVVGGKYRLERPLARGGMGSVWEGRHLDLDSPVAVKFMGYTSDPATGRARFEREARASASLRSPHVVQVLDYGAAGDTPYIVMELLEGEDLGQRLTRCGRLPLADVASIVRQLSRGLALAHERGIVHRDLKPGNVFLTTVGQEEVVKVLDFGVAKETRVESSETQTTTGVVVGSPSYMSPEQARGGRVDARSDLWSLGVLVFQALTGRRPFEGSSLADVLVRICSEPILVATSIAPDLPAELDAFFDRALCRSPDGRFQDVQAMNDALSAIAFASTGEMVLASRPAGSARARDEATGAIAAQPRETTGPTLVQLRAPLAVTTVAPAQSPREPPADGTLTSSGAVSISTRGVKPPPAFESSPAQRARPTPARSVASRSLFWGLGGAALVGALWALSQSGLFSRGDKQTASADASTTVTASAAAEPSPPTVSPAGSGAEAKIVTTASIAASAALEPTSSAVSSVAVRPVSVPPPGRPPPGRPPPARPPPTGTSTIDPKFGLPVGPP